MLFLEVAPLVVQAVVALDVFDSDDVLQLAFSLNVTNTTISSEKFVACSSSLSTVCDQFSDNFKLCV